MGCPSRAHPSLVPTEPTGLQLSHPYLTCDFPGRPSAITVGELTGMLSHLWAGLRDLVLLPGFNLPWTDESIWFYPGHLVPGHVTGSHPAMDIAPRFSTVTYLLRHACPISPGPLAVRESVGLLPEAGSVSGLTSGIQTPPRFLLASGPALNTWPAGPMPIGSRHSDCMVLAAPLMAQPPGLQCRGKPGRDLSQSFYRLHKGITSLASEIGGVW